MSRTTNVIVLFAAFALIVAPARYPAADPVLETGADHPLNAKNLAKAKFENSVGVSDVNKLQLAMVEVSRKEFNERYEEFRCGRGTLDTLFNAAARLLEAESAVAGPDKVVAVLEKHWLAVKQIEDINKARYEAGRIPSADYAESQFHRLKAEVVLSKAKENRQSGKE